MQANTLLLFNQLLPDLLYIVALVVIYYTRMLYKLMFPKVEALIDAHLTAKQREMIKDLGHEAFTYAETLYRSKNGPDKLHEAHSYFKHHMSKYGLSNLSYEVIRTAIERAWLTDKIFRANNSAIATIPSDSQPETPSLAENKEENHTV